MASDQDHATKDFVVHNNDQPANEAPIPSENNSDSWKGWILGVLVSIFRQRLNPLLVLKGEAVIIVETTEYVMEVVEKVAEEVVEITDDLGAKLPEDGKFKRAINIVGNLAREIDQDAHLVEDFIHKVEELEEEVESFILVNYPSVEGTTK